MKLSFSGHPASSPCGFSLVELLTAMAIGSIVLVAAAAILAASNRSSEAIRDALSATREQGEVLHLLTEDLSTTVAHPQNQFESPQNTTNPLNQSESSYHLAFLCLKPAAAQPAASRMADLCAVRYALADLPSATGRTRCLIRQLIPSREMFAALRSDQPWFAPNPFNPPAEPVAIGVLHLHADLLVPGSDGNWTTQTTGLSPSVPGLSPQTETRRAIRLRVVLATPALRSRLTRSEDWDSLAGFASSPPSAWPAKWRSQLVPLELILPIGPSS